MAQALESIYYTISYRGREGHWAWLLHRVAGIGILLFLFLHIVDIFLVGVGEEIFTKFLFIYSHPLFKVAELALIFGVLYHAFNGVRIILVDFRPERFSNWKTQRTMFRIVLVVTLIFFIPAAITTIGPLFHFEPPWWIPL
ncbi:MAG: succinate dehydrogenase, cytochrome b556 subunit [Chloroflexota bacterium]|nr:succinate dehydrogenase, cytochrome b556 subunit [Chloroflexota bacterium]